MTETAARVDVRGMACSDAVVKLHKALMPMGAGGAVVVVADNEDVMADLRKYAARAGHRWVTEKGQVHGVIEAEVQRGG